VSPPQAPTVFIVILNWNGLQDTLECLASVSKLNYSPRQVIVVDNGSTDGSPGHLKAAYPDVTLIEHGVNLGYTGGNNAAMRYALAHGADFVWLLNNDAVVEPDSLTKLVATAGQDQNIGLMSPITYDYSDRGRIQFLGVRADMARQALVLDPDPREGLPGSYLSRPLLWGTALLIRSTVIQRIGYLDDRYFAYHEDVDYSLRALNAGFRTLLEPAAVVYHKWAGSSGGDSPLRNYLLTRNWYLFWSTHLKGVPRYTYLPRYLAWAARQAVSFKETGNHLTADACLDGAWSALRGRYGPPHNVIAMPQLIRHAFYTHPYFWIWLLAGELRNIFRAVATSLRRRT
jgi:GT2 family glycosyltransferase